jgi:hypothetical protein
MEPEGMVAMLTMTGLVSLAPAAHEGTAMAERVTITSAGAAVGQPGLMVMTEVAASEGAAMGAAEGVVALYWLMDVRRCT